MKIPFPFSGTGMGVENSIPDFRDGNWRPVFPGIPGIGNSRSWLGGILIFFPQIYAFFVNNCRNRDLRNFVKSPSEKPQHNVTRVGRGGQRLFEKY